MKELSVQKNVVVISDSPETPRGTKLGRWTSPGGTTHTVSIIEKDSMNYWSKLGRTINPFQISVDTGEHILLLEKKEIKHLSEESKCVVLEAFHALGRQSSSLSILDGIASEEKLQPKDGVQEVDGKRYLVKHKEHNGSYSYVARPLRLVQSEGSIPQREIEAIQAQLWAKGEDSAKAQAPLMEELLEQADKNGEASVFVNSQECVYRAKLLKNPDGSFVMRCTKMQITEGEIERAGLKGRDAAHLRTHGDAVLQKLFEMTLGLSGERRAAGAEGRKAQYVLYPSGETMLDSEKRVVVRLHVKKDGSVSLGIGMYLGAGSHNTVRKVSVFGIQIKEYVESFLRYEVPLDVVSRKAEELQKFAHPYILETIRFFERTISRYDERMATVEVKHQIGLKTKYCEHATADSLVTMGPPKRKGMEYRMRFIFGFQVAQALSFIHSKGYAHMDIKPENIYLTGNPPEVRVGDMDPKKIGEESFSTLVYADFEANQSCPGGKGKPPSDPANDVWALGITLFELLYGRNANPFIKMKNLRDKAEFEKALETLKGQLGESAADNLMREMLTLMRKDRVSLDENFLLRYQQIIVGLGGETPLLAASEPSTPRLIAGSQGARLSRSCPAVLGAASSSGAPAPPASPQALSASPFTPPPSPAVPSASPFTPPMSPLTIAESPSPSRQNTPSGSQGVPSEPQSAVPTLSPAPVRKKDQRRMTTSH